MSNNRGIILTVNGKIVDENPNNQREIRFRNNVDKIGSMAKKIKAENLVMNEVYEISINQEYNPVNSRIMLKVNCEKDEIPLLILKDYWNNIEEKLVYQNDELVHAVLNSNKAIPCIFPKYEEKASNNNEVDSFSFSALDFWNIFRTLTNNDDKSLFLFILKVKPYTKSDNLGISLIENKNDELVPVECNIQELIDSSKKNIAIFVHGIASRVGTNFAGLYKCLEADFNIFAFNYDSISKEIFENGKILSSNLSVFGERPIHIFAHSMGGLVSRSAIVQHNAQVQTLLMAGTPNNGAKFAKKVHNSLGINGAFRKILLSVLVGLDFFKLTYNDLMKARKGDMPGLKDLYPKSEFTIKLNNQENFKTKYLVLAGKKNFQSKDGFVEVRSMCNVRGISLPNILINGCSHTRYFIANPRFDLPDIVSEARLYLKI